MVKSPASTASNLNEPVPSVVALRVDPEAVFSSVTTASGICAPTVSTTVPRMLPVDRESADVIDGLGASGSLAMESVEKGVEAEVAGGIVELEGPDGDAGDCACACRLRITVSREVRIKGPEGRKLHITNSFRFRNSTPVATLAS